jgi:hypothetical protein
MITTCRKLYVLITIKKSTCNLIWWICAAEVIVVISLIRPCPKFCLDCGVCCHLIMFLSFYHNLLRCILIFYCLIITEL